METSNQVFASLDSYFNTLSLFGYKNTNDVNKLLVFTFIEELLTGPMRYYITEADYRIIEQALYCLYGSSCLIPYPVYKGSSLFGVEGDVFINPRITEDSNIRSTEDDYIRY